MNLLPRVGGVEGVGGGSGGARPQQANKWWLQRPERPVPSAAGRSEAKWFLNSARSFFESPLTELPQHVSDHQYIQGKAALERMNK